MTRRLAQEQIGLAANNAQAASETRHRYTISELEAEIRSLRKSRSTARRAKTIAENKLITLRRNLRESEDHAAGAHGGRIEAESKAKELYRDIRSFEEHLEGARYAADALEAKNNELQSKLEMKARPLRRALTIWQEDQLNNAKKTIESCEASIAGLQELNQKQADEIRALEERP